VPALIPTARAGSTSTRASQSLASRSLRWLVLGVLLLGTGACRKGERLLLLEVRASGQLPTSVSAIRFSAMGWQTRSVAGVLGPTGLRFGYYGPSGSGPVTVTAEAIDVRNCVLGTGSATVLDTSSGQTAPVTVIYVRPLEPTTCILPDAGFDGGDADASDASAADGPSTDAEGGTDTGADSRSDARVDGSDGAVDRFGDATGDTRATGDAGVDAIRSADVGPVTDGGGTGASDAADASPG
jgi:hypothetical protein